MELSRHKLEKLIFFQKKKNSYILGGNLQSPKTTKKVTPKKFLQKKFFLTFWYDC